MEKDLRNMRFSKKKAVEILVYALIALTVHTLQQTYHQTELHELTNKNKELNALLDYQNKGKKSNDAFKPFRIVAKPTGESCVKKEQVIAISSALKDLRENYKMRIFPRNSFLLGVVRHGGFLPQENIDSDLAYLHTDLQKNLKVNVKNDVGGVTITPEPTVNTWVNWKGNDPLSGKPFPFFCIQLSHKSLNNVVCPFYPYHKGIVFYPRPNIKGFNHEGNVKEMQRWNKEGADMRLVDTNELVTETNFAEGKQIGSVFPSISFDCMVEKQFYFTTIHVPCGYDTILLAQYGKNWRNVEKRLKWESMKMSEANNLKYLDAGPLPLCAM